MIDTNPDHLYRQIEGSIKHRDKCIRHLSDVRSAYTGPAVGGHDKNYDPENFAYELVSWMVPQMVDDNPKVRAKSARGASQQEAAQALGAALNRWVRDTRMREDLLPMATDTMLCWGVAIITEEEGSRSIPPGIWQTLTSTEDPTEEAQPMWPVMSRIEPERYFRDHAEQSPRFEGHKWIRDKDDLLAMAKEDSTWDVEAIERIATPEGLDDPRRKGKDIPNRNEVEAYEVWIPEIELDTFPGEEEGAPSTEDGYHGTIFTLSVRKGPAGERPEVAFIRKPRPFYGPRWGPYVLFGIHDNGGDYPFSPVMAVKAQVDELNRIGKSMTKSAEKRKKLGLFASRDAALAKAIKTAEDETLIGIEGYEPGKGIDEIEVGGLSDQQILWRNDRRALVDRVSGFTDMQRGSVGGDATATEATIADSNSAIRTGFIQTQFRNAVERVLRTVAWYMYHDDQIIFPLSPEDMPEMGFEPGAEVWYQGGDYDPESGATFDDLELEIEAYSMQRTNEGIRQVRMMEFFQTLMTTFPWMAQAPNAPWADMWSMYGEANNMPEARALGAKFAEALAGMPVMPEGGQARTGKDVGGQAAPQSQGFPGNFSGAQAGGAL